MIHQIYGRNVTEILPKGIDYLVNFGRKEPSRAGDVLVATTPVITVYERPWEKVLFNKIRDANPIFHILEAIPWMLSGDDDAEFLNYYVKDFGSRYAESDGRVHGAYGRRWRKHFSMDQLAINICKLKENKYDRQAVIQMWDAHMDSDDYTKGNDLVGKWRDRCCNTQCYVRINDNRLDLTVMARSNDALFGAWGANAVHFAFLQEYLAGMLEVGIGRLYQFSNNLHLYTAELEKLEKRLDEDLRKCMWETRLCDPRYQTRTMRPEFLVTNPKTFDRELRIVTNWVKNLQVDVVPDHYRLDNIFLSGTVYPVALTHQIYKRKGSKVAMDVAQSIQSDDWRQSVIEWIERRVK